MRDEHHLDTQRSLNGACTTRGRVCVPLLGFCCFQTQFLVIIIIIDPAFVEPTIFQVLILPRSVDNRRN